MKKLAFELHEFTIYSDYFIWWCIKNIDISVLDYTWHKYYKLRNCFRSIVSCLHIQFALYFAIRLNQDQDKEKNE